MKKNNLTKLVALATVLLVSVGTIAGSTVAWFTDTEYAVNTIQSGSLDIEWEYAAHDSEAYSPVPAEDAIIGVNALYEPGYTEVVKLKVQNAGDLALKYKLNVVILEDKPGIGRAPDPDNEDDYDLYLSEYLKVAAMPADELPADRASIWDMMENDVSYLDESLEGDTIPVSYVDENKVSQEVDAKYLPVIEGRLYPAADSSTEESTEESTEAGTEEGESTEDDSSEEIALILCMPTSVGNEANHTPGNKPSIKLGLYLEAAQLTSESDSYGDDYDADATYADGTTGMPEEEPEEEEEEPGEEKPVITAELDNGAQIWYNHDAGSWEITGINLEKLTDYTISFENSDTWDHTYTDTETEVDYSGRVLTFAENSLVAAAQAAATNGTTLKVVLPYGGYSYTFEEGALNTAETSNKVNIIVDPRAPLYSTVTSIAANNFGKIVDNTPNVTITYYAKSGTAFSSSDLAAALGEAKIVENTHYTAVQTDPPATAIYRDFNSPVNVVNVIKDDTEYYWTLNIDLTGDDTEATYSVVRVNWYGEVEHTIPDTITADQEKALLPHGYAVGHKVTKILGDAYSQSSDIMKVTLGANIAQIDPDAFNPGVTLVIPATNSLPASSTYAIIKTTGTTTPADGILVNIVYEGDKTDWAGSNAQKYFQSLKDKYTGYSTIYQVTCDGEIIETYPASTGT